MYVFTQLLKTNPCKDAAVSFTLDLNYFLLFAASLFLSPAAEIDHVSNLFQEKQAELQSAVVRVDQVTNASLRLSPRGFQLIQSKKHALHFAFCFFSCTGTFVSLLFPLANPAAGGLEKRTPPAALPGTRNRSFERFARPTCRPQGLGSISACSPGAQETLPGAAGTSSINSSACP